MLELGKKLLFKAFGFSISSDIDFPELAKLPDPVSSIDIEIKVEDTTRSDLYMQLMDKPDQFVIKPNWVGFHIQDVAMFAIQNGNTITVLPLNGADHDVIRLYVLGTCMGALLLQRKIIPLHGSAIAIEGKAYAIVGDSGAGKSTLASAFLNQGYLLLSDDVIAVSVTPENGLPPVVTPSYPQQKLWQDSLSNFGMATSDYQSIFGRETKYTVPVASKYYSEPLPLAGVFELVKTEDSSIEMVRINKLHRFSTLYDQTFRQFLIPGLGLVEWHFKASAAIVNQIEMYQLRRPISSFTAPQLVSLILDTIKMEG